jgi:hypothetical protein
MELSNDGNTKIKGEGEMEGREKISKYTEKDKRMEERISGNTEEKGK